MSETQLVLQAIQPETQKFRNKLIKHSRKECNKAGSTDIESYAACMTNKTQEIEKKMTLYKWKLDWILANNHHSCVKSAKGNEEKIRVCDTVMKQQMEVLGKEFTKSFV